MFGREHSRRASKNCSATSISEEGKDVKPHNDSSFSVLVIVVMFVINMQAIKNEK